MAIAIAVLATTLTVSAQTPDVNRAANVVRILHDNMKNPDSFVLTGVFLKPNKGNNSPNICVSYRSQNSFGGMTPEWAAQLSGKGEFHNRLQVPDQNFNSELIAFGYCKASELQDITSQVEAVLGVVRVVSSIKAQ